MSSLKEMLKLFALFLCCSVSLSDWMEDYNNDKRPLCSNEWKKNGRMDEGRIFGGIRAGRRRFPFVVGLLLTTKGIPQYDALFGGGTLITDRHVLTAAHTMTRRLKESIRVTVGDYDLLKANEVTSYLRKIDTVQHHPDFDIAHTFDSDIAILTLDEPIPLNRRMKIPVLPPFGRELITGTRCTIWGWGETEESKDGSSILLKVRVPIVARDACQKLTENPITPNMICAGGKQGKDSCLDDGGVSLLSQVDDVDCLVGIASFKINECGLKGIPSVYVNVAKFTDWIYTNTKNGSCKPQIIQ